MNFPLYFQKVIWPAYGLIFDKKNSEKAKHPKICLSLGGSMPEAQIWKLPDSPRYPPPP